MTQTPSKLLGKQVGREAEWWTHGFCILVGAPILWIIVKLGLQSWWLLVPFSIFWLLSYIQFYNAIYNARWQRAMLDNPAKES